MQAIEQICGEHPLSGRVDSTVVFFHSPDPKLGDWVSQYQSENPESRIIIPLDSKTLKECVDDRWRIINSIKDTLFIRNLFDYKLPLKSDRYFYGREGIVASLIDNARKSQNSGLFGLRKTGKTSVLLKIERVLQKSGEFESIFFDCKTRPIWKCSCDELASRIIEKLASKFKKNFKFKEGEDVFDALTRLVVSLPGKKKIIVIFDEIEYISPISSTNINWKGDFIEFWQALWTLQTQCDRISYIVAGVNSTICDTDRFESVNVPGRTVQNPMFSIFNTRYLTGMSKENLSNMIKFFGTHMGLFFENEAIDLIHEEYGGHPLLTRLACSFHHEALEARKIERPIKVTKKDIENYAAQRDAELSSYCGHVVSEVAELYTSEYELLKMLAAGEIADFTELTNRHEDIRHIRDYGLVNVDAGQVPTFKIPVVKRYLKLTEREAIAFDEKNRFRNPDDKIIWLKNRLNNIVDDLLILLSEAKRIEATCIYKGAESLKGHKFIDTIVVETESDAVSFLVHAHKYLVEPADKFLSKGVAKNEDFKKDLGSLRTSFMRLKAYRNRHCHIDINNETQTGYDNFLLEDFDGHEISNVEQGWFKLQRIILDNIHVALQAELSKF